MECILNSSKLAVFKIDRHLIPGAKTPLVTSSARRGRVIYLESLYRPWPTLILKLVATTSPFPVIALVVGRKK